VGSVIATARILSSMNSGMTAFSRANFSEMIFSRPWPFSGLRILFSREA